MEKFWYAPSYFYKSLFVVDIMQCRISCVQFRSNWIIAYLHAISLDITTPNSAASPESFVFFHISFRCCRLGASANEMKSTQISSLIVGTLERCVCVFKAGRGKVFEHSDLRGPL